MAAGKVRGRAVGRHVWLRRSLPQKRGGVEPHGDDETRVRRARCRPRADICVWPAAAVLSARANPALINWQVNFTSDPDNLLHISDESAASEPWYQQTRVKWQSAEPPRRSAGGLG